MVYYRKYRPQKIDDLDSEAVRETLISVLSQKPPHAFLFTGPKGLGKTSTARIVAKVVNCTGRKSDKDIEPCNKCEQCISITNGTNLDILEIDAASNRGIDEIRDLKEKIRLSPSSARMKVYIIDEVHMLTTEAFNALLKTLEEPPPHAMFILCTTEPQKVPATIISRCFHLSFLSANKEDLIRSFKRIVKGEKLQIDNKALETIADLSEGGFRDGAKILEEVALLSNGKKITQDLIDEKYNVSSIKSKIVTLLRAIEKYDTKAGLQTVSELVREGVDIKLFIQQMMDMLHTELLSLVQNNKTENTNQNIQRIKIMLDGLQKAYQESKYAVLQQLPLELMIIEMTQSSTSEVSEVVENTVSVSQNGSSSVNDLRKQVGNIRKNKAMYGSAKQNADLKEDSDNNISSKAAISLLHTPVDGEENKEWMQNFWNNIISEMKSYNHTIAGVLRGCSIGSYDKNNLVIEAHYKFHKERLDDIKIKNELSRIAKMLTGKDVTVVVELKSK